MNILADTNILIWALRDSPKLSQKSRELILNPENIIFYTILKEPGISARSFFTRNPKTNIVSYH